MKQKRHWGKAIASFLLVLFTMPLGHATMILMEHYLTPTTIHYAAFAMGAIGFLMVIIGVFAKGDTKQTLWGLIGGLFFWTGWVEFLFMYYARRYGTQPEIIDDVIVTKPEYLILPASFGFWMMFMLIYLFSIRSGCNFFNWCQKKLFRSKRSAIVARPMTRHTAIVTFMELNMILWTSYLLLMFCYDPRFLGDHHPVTFLVGVVCFFGSLFIFAKQLRLSTWGANIRMAIATVIVFWTPIEILGRINFFQEFWIEPLQYKWEMLAILIGFILLAYFVYYRSRNEKKHVA
jgi:hypothetical protein